MSPTPASEVFQVFRIDLDVGPNTLFKGGERISGNVKIKLKKEIVIQVIRIQFKGRAFHKETKKGRDAEKIFFDKDFVLLERPPGNAEAGHFTWKADFEYSLPFQYILPLGCPSSYESPDAFVRYFTRVTFQPSDSKAVYVAKKHFSVYDLDTVAAIDPRYQEPFTYRHTFASGGCCCKRQIYFEYIMPKRVFYAGEDIEGKMIIDNISDERIAQDIHYSIVERTVKPELNEEEAMKYPARVLKSSHINGSRIEKKKNQLIINQLLVPNGAPLSVPNAVALASLPRDKTSPQLSPDEKASKLFEHESIISQSRKEPIFRVHYAVQLHFGKFIVEVPFVVRPVESEDVRTALKTVRFNPDIEAPVQIATGHVAQAKESKLAPQFAESDEHDMIFPELPIEYTPQIPAYIKKPKDDHVYSWPSLGTYGTNQKLIWHPDKKLTKEQKAEQVKSKKEEQLAKKRQQAEEKEAKKQAKKQKKPDKELLIVTAANEPEPNSMSVNIESVTVDNPLTPVPSQVVVEPSSSLEKQPEIVVEEFAPVPAVTEEQNVVEEKPKKKTKAELKAEKEELKRVKREEKLAEKQRKKDEKLAEQQRKEAEKREKEQAKIDAKNAKIQEKEEQKRLKKEEAERKKQDKEQAKLEAKNKKKQEKEPLVEETAADVPGPSEEGHIESTVIITETIVEQHGDEEPNVSVTRTVTEQRDNDEPVVTKVELTGHQELLDSVVEQIEPVVFEPQPITEEIVIVSNGRHPDQNGHHEENGTNGKLDGEIETNGHHINEEDADAATTLKKKNAEANENAQPTEA